MSAVELLHRETDYRLLRTQEDPASHSHWCFMHAQRYPRDIGAYRACFSVALMKEMREFLKRTADRINGNPPTADTAPRHVVMASDANVYNLGGDLELFCRLIRERNREHLLAYARLCVEGVHEIHSGLNRSVNTIALVQGDALGGGFELALSCHTIVAESGVGMGFPEVLFDLFPGMGAYSYLSQRVSPRFAEEMMLNGTIYTSDELHRMGIVDVLVPKGEGVQAVQELIRRNHRIPHARAAMNRVRQIRGEVSLAELMQITEVWVDTAMQLGEKSLRTMERLVRAQRKPINAEPVAAEPAVALTAAG
ncbi:MAG TPA: crotonase/enoyl-CoA hydratase family protein [Dokdonella sp.]